MSTARHRFSSGFTLLEMLVSILILGIIVVGIQQVLASTLSSSNSVSDRTDVLMQARAAMERMVTFAQESDEIVSPSGSGEETLKVGDRVTDTRNNASRAYVAAGDSHPDADRNGDGLIDTNDGTSRDYITFYLDKTDGQNWKLMEQAPDYNAEAAGSVLSGKVICDHVSRFQCSRLSPGLVAIQLTMTSGKTTVALRSRARARLIE